MKVIVEWDFVDGDWDVDALLWAHDIGWHEDFPQEDCNACNGPDAVQDIPLGIADEDVADYLSDRTGWLVKSYRYVEID